MHPLPCLALFTTVALATVLAWAQEQPPKRQLPTPVVERVRDLLQPEVDKRLAEAQKRTLEALKERSTLPGFAKTALVQKGLTKPWEGLRELEQHGLALAGAVQGPHSVSDLLARMSGLLGKSKHDAPAVDRRKTSSFAEIAEDLVALLDDVKKRQEKALKKVETKERQFHFRWSSQFLDGFGPQTIVTEKTKPTLQNDRALIAQVHQLWDWAEFAGSAHLLARLVEPVELANVKRAGKETKPIDRKLPGCTGDILYHRETKHGAIIVGGPGKNTYDLNFPVAVLIDLGGDDHYQGTIGASFDAERNNSIVIDLDGDDTYEPTEFGLATGRMGVGMVFDLAGNDHYRLSRATGGVGIAGIGVLCDVSGNDRYEGSKYTQGVGFAGLGLLLDLGGDDVHTSHGYALGFGGPDGVGAVIDASGNDSYECGFHFPSGYNTSDAPNAKPGDPAFQWDAWGLGMGLGRRIFPRGAKPEDHAYALAGGFGVVIDLDGKDRYRSSNFSQGCGYYFGTGLVLDLAGDDWRQAARYGNASGAHYGFGLHIDYAGKDEYTTTGPTYNGGCAWDHSVFLCVDGDGDDTYDFRRSSGPALADIGSWAAFADLAGRDRYLTSGGLGRASDRGLALFLDAADEDDYRGVPAGAGRKVSDGHTQADPAGWLFVDR